MKKVGRRVWVWILSGFALLFGTSCHFHRAPETIYGPPEELYGPPTPEMEVDSISEPDTNVEQIEE